MTRRAVIFDMGNVLIDWDPQEAYRPHLPDAGDRVAFLSRFFPRMYNAVHDDPRSMSLCLAPLKDAHPEMRHLIEVYELEWHRFLGGPMPDSIEILDALHEKGVPLYGLTNWPHQVWPPHKIEGVENPDAYGFLGKFEDIVVSGQVRLRKPDAAIYRYALETFGLRGEEAVFVDDLPENVDAARELGLHGIRFTDAGALREELMQLGLL